MKTKFLAFFVLFILLSAAASCANTAYGAGAEITAAQNGATVQLKGKISLAEPTEQISATVFRKGQDPLTAAAGAYVWADSKKSSGEFSFDMDLKAATGEYTAYISSEYAENAVSYDFWFADGADLVSAINALNGANSAAAMESALRGSIGGAELYKLLQVNINEANALNSAADVYQYLVDLRPYSADNSGAVSEKFHIGVTVRRVNESSDTALIKNLSVDELKLDKSDPIIENIYKNYISGIDNVFEYLKKADVKNYDLLKEAFAESVILAACRYPKNGRYDVESAITEAKDKIRITAAVFAEYTALPAPKRVAVIESIQGKQLDGLGKLSETFTASVRAQANAPDNNTPIGGSPIGGGGGGGAASIPNPAAGIDMSEAPNIGGAGFNDIENVSWARNAINILSEKGILSGRGGGVFAPNDNITREEFVKIAVLAFEIKVSGAADFADVADSDWFSSYVGSAVGAGIVRGLDNGSFGVGLNITREDLAVMCYRALADKISFKSEGLNFTDSGEISDYALEAVSALNADGIINGFEDGAFRPKNTATRAEAAKIVYGLINMKG